MKTLTLLAAVSLLSFSNSVFAKCYYNADFYLDESHYHHDYNWNVSFNIDTLIEQSEAISISVNYYYTEAGNLCDYDNNYPAAYEWKKNGTVVSNSQVYTITDTGFYESRLTMMSGVSKYAYLHVGYSNVTSVNELNTDTKFSFYPSHSSGIFQIKSEQSLSKILISDNVGRQVFNTSENLSSINISGLPVGVYFYYVEDKSGQAYRGRIIKD
jgi:hypothetical protein